MESASSTTEATAPAPAGLIWLHRGDDLFIQIPAAAKEKVLAKPDRAVFRSFMAFAIVSILAGFGYSEGLPPGAGLVGLIASLILGALLWQVYKKRRTLLSVAHLPTTIDISSGTISIDAPHTWVHLIFPVQRVRDLTACISRFEGFGVGLHGVQINTGYSVRLTLELDNNEAHDVMIKCELNQQQTLQLETDLRKTLGLPALKPP